MNYLNPTGAGSAVPLSGASATAYLILQERLLSETRSSFIDRDERAADELLRNPHRTGDPVKIVRRAMANARKVVLARQRLTVPNNEIINEVPANDEGHSCAIELHDFIDRAKFGARDKYILHALLNGSDTEDIARGLNVGLERARVYVSRARLAARRSSSST